MLSTPWRSRVRGVLLRLTSPGGRMRVVVSKDTVYQVSLFGGGSSNASSSSSLFAIVRFASLARVCLYDDVGSEKLPPSNNGPVSCLGPVAFSYR